MEKLAKINTKMSKKVYSYLEEEEILDSKEEEELWYEEMADKIKVDEEKLEQQKREKEEEEKEKAEKRRKKKNKDGEDGKNDDDEDPEDRVNTGKKLPLNREKTIHKYTEANPIGVKNFFHEPDSPSRAFLLEHMSVWYLLKL